MRRLWSWALILLLLVPLQCLFGQASTTGSWSPLETWPYRAVHAHLLPNGKVLFWSYYDEALTPQIWDPTSDSVVPAASISYSIFCAGHSFLADGRLLVTGGHQADYVGFPNASIYDPLSNTWTATPNMNAGRWYPTNTTLPNGDVLVIDGDINSGTNLNTLPQVYQVASNSWRNLSSAQLALPLYPRMFVAPNGSVFESGPDPTSRYLNTSGAGSWTSVATMNFTASRDYGSAVMYQPGKILTMGGGDPPTASAEIIDLNSATPTWQPTGSLNFARRQINATVLPDGKILVTGGSGGSGFDNNNAPVETSEIWDPATGKFTKMASESTYRGYHSTALLLPDGRVVSAGGNVGGPTAQIYSPPYLFQGTRPTISSAPNEISYGSTFSVGTPDAATITSVSLIRNGSVTHAFNMDQRFMQLNYTQTSGGLTVTAPSNANIAPPGYYMLFVLRNGVPSVAAIVRLSAAIANSGSIQGQVTDSSGAPLSGATVSYNGGSTITDANGSYVLAGVAAGSVTLTASLSGYQSNSVQVTVSSGTTVTAPVIALTRIPTGTISGSVQSASGSTLANVTVAYSGGSATTGSSGHYTLTAVPVGTVSVTASTSGYQSSTQSVAVTANTTATANFSLNPIPTGTIAGNVVSTSGAPIAGATVAYGGASTSTDSNGNYTLANVQVGTVTVAVTAAGYQGATQNVTVTANATVTANFTLAANAVPGTVTGSVRNISNNDPVIGATVTFSGGTTTTNSSGAFSFSNVAAGTYAFTASATGYLTRSQTFTVSGPTTITMQIATAGIVTGKVNLNSGTAAVGATVTLTGGDLVNTVTLTTNSTGNYTSTWIPIGKYTLTVSLSGYASQSVPVTVPNGTVTVPLITLSPGTASTGTISGTVTSSEGSPLSGATVSYSGGSTATNSSGSYTLTNVPAGAIMLTASAGGYQSSTQSVTITANNTTTANFSLAPSTVQTGSISGQVLNTSGAAISGAIISYSGGSTTTNATGSYSLAGIAVGTVTLTAAATGYQSATQSVAVTANTTSTANFTLTPASTTATVTGRLSNISNNDTIVGGTVSFSGGTTTTNSAGTYTFANVAPGTYNFTAVANGYLPRTFSIAVTSPTTTLNFPLATADKIAGKVTSPSGAAVAGASVTISGGIIPTTATLTTNSTGNYLSNWIPVGTYTITVALSGHTTQTKTATVVAGGITTTVNFTGF